MRRSLLPVLVAAVGIGLAGARSAARAPEPGRTVGSEELTSAGNVVGTDARSSLFRDDDDRDRVRQAIRRGANGTYITEMLLARDSALARWPDRGGEPLLVWIQPASVVNDWHSDYVHQVYGAFTAWDTLNLPVRFRVIADSAKAHVHVTWIDHFSEPISGRTRWARDASYWITDANIVLAVHHRTGELLEDDAMHAMALHEIGHLLGLDHTTDPSSVMAPKVRVRSLSDADRATVRLLYSLPAGVYSSR